MQSRFWILMALAAASWAASSLSRNVLRGRRRPRPSVLTPHGNQMPSTVHRTLHASELKPGRLVVVGDVHGCSQELDALLAKLGFSADEDNLLFVGDLVNKGPASVQVVDTFVRLGALGVRGNHDDSSLYHWHTWRRGQAIKQRRAWVTELPPQHVQVLESLPFSISLPDYGIIIVHAGLVPGLPLSSQEPWAMYKMRNVAPVPRVGTAGFAAVEKGVQGSTAWAGQWQGPQHVFFGHDAKRRLQLQPHATGLDTGCVYGNSLSAAVLPPLRLLMQQRAAADLESWDSPISGQLGVKLSSGLPITREDLGVVIVAVPAARVYEQPSGPHP